jgi:hypothetical protein
MAQRNIVITNLAEVAAARAALPAQFRPTKQPNGRWHMPKWGALRVARERRQTLLRGEQWPYEVPHKEVVKRVMFKGHKRDARRLERAAEIERCMQRMPEMVAEYRASRIAAKRARQKAKDSFRSLVSEPRDRFEGITTRDLSPKKGQKGKKTSS